MLLAPPPGQHPIHSNPNAIVVDSLKNFPIAYEHYRKKS